MSKIVGVGVIIILVSFFGFIILSKEQTLLEPSSSGSSKPIASTNTSAPKDINITASFAIFTHGTFRIFTASMYHNLSEDAYIEAVNPNIIYVKKAAITWNNFFTTLPFKLTSECLTTGTKETFCTGNGGALKFYINGEQNNGALSEEIKEGDKLLVTFGNESEEVIKQQFNKIP